MRILIKYPTRGRPQQFLTTLRGWLTMAASPAELAVLVSYDEDDATMTPDIIQQAETMHPAVVCVRGKSISKIDACNRDVNEYAGDWDIILLVSDDMWCVAQGWDDIVRHAMRVNFPDGDGALWFHDGSRQRVICTLSCMGRAFYRRFNYLYHPDYRSFWSDNEFTDVASGLGKLVFIESPIARHQHPSWGGAMKRDATYQRNNKYWAQDEATYHERKSKGFPR